MCVLSSLVVSLSKRNRVLIALIILFFCVSVCVGVLDERIQTISPGGRGCPDNVFLVIYVLHKGPYEPPSRSNGTLRVGLLLEGVRTSISRESYNQWGGGVLTGLILMI